MLIIGYQGVEGSNSEKAALELAKKNKFKEFQLLPLVSSFNVLDNVIKKRVHHGIIAVENSMGGRVVESDVVLTHLNLRKLDEITLSISHFLFVKNKNISITDIKKIASHPQAFKQCHNSLENKFPEIVLLKDEDTATAARKLALGIFTSDVAVLCRKNAGEMNGLHLLVSHLEDSKDNKTTFEMY
jgi:prephenate dehydratase